MEFFKKVVTFLTKPLLTGKIYVCGIYVEHSREIFLEYSKKIFKNRNIPWPFHECPTIVTNFFWWIKKYNSRFLFDKVVPDIC